MTEEGIHIRTSHRFVGGIYKSLRKHSLFVWLLRMPRKDWKCEEVSYTNILLVCLCVVFVSVLMRYFKIPIWIKWERRCAFNVHGRICMNLCCWPSFLPPPPPSPSSLGYWGSHNLRTGEDWCALYCWHSNTVVYTTTSYSDLVESLLDTMQSTGKLEWW